MHLERIRTLGISVVGNAEFRIHRRLIDNKSKGIGDSDVGNKLTSILAIIPYMLREGPLLSFSSVFLRSPDES